MKTETTNKAKLKYIITWNEDDDEDQFNMYNNLDEVKKFISETLITNEYVDQSSITLYKVQSINTVKVEIIFN